MTLILDSSTLLSHNVIFQRRNFLILPYVAACGSYLQMHTIKISLVGVPLDYGQSLLPLIINKLGYHINWVKPSSCDLLIYGPFFRPLEKQFRWLPRPVRPLALSFEEALKNSFGPRHAPLRLFHTAENKRHDAIAADFSIGFDLAVESDRHFRLPYWMELVDWSQEGLSGTQNPRFGQLLNISKLMVPLGRRFLDRPRTCAIISSHLREPRATLTNAVGKLIPVAGYGPYFDKRIADHHRSGFSKFDLLQQYAFNLCPENGLYPGYYTEKIPEAFQAGCLPLAWADTNVGVDFNSDAFINLEPMTWQGFEPLREIINSPAKLGAYAEQPLLLSKPSIEPFMDFLREVVRQATG